MENSTKPIPNSSYLSHLLYFVLVSIASNCCLRSAGPWREAGRIFLWLNFDWPTSSSFSGVIYFFSFPGMDHVAFFQKALMLQWKSFWKWLRLLLPHLPADTRRENKNEYWLWTRGDKGTHTLKNTIYKHTPSQTCVMSFQKHNFSQLDSKVRVGRSSSGSASPSWTHTMLLFSFITTCSNLFMLTWVLEIHLL